MTDVKIVTDLGRDSLARVFICSHVHVQNVPRGTEMAKKGTLFGKPRGEIIKHPGAFKAKAKKGTNILDTPAFGPYGVTPCCR